MSNCVDCPDEQNYAAIALQLQETALQAEACLYAVETSLREVTNPETILLTMTGSQGAAVNVLTRIGGGVGTVTFANTPRINFLTTSIPWTPGVWEVGACITVTSTGAVTADSLRELFIITRRTNDSTAIPDTFQSVLTMTEPNDGVGVDMSHTTVVVLDEGEEIRFYIRTTNVTGVTVAAGALFWASRLSDASSLRVVG